MTAMPWALPQLVGEGEVPGASKRRRENGGGGIPTNSGGAEQANTPPLQQPQQQQPPWTAQQQHQQQPGQQNRQQAIPAERRLLMQVARRVTALESVAYVTIKLPAGSPLVASLKLVGQQYRAATRDNASHGRGAPHPYYWAEAVKFCAGVDVTNAPGLAAVSQAVKTHLGEITTAGGLSAAARVCGSMKVKICHDTNWATVSFAPCPTPTAPMLTDAVMQLLLATPSASLLTGEAPRTALEREVARGRGAQMPVQPRGKGGGRGARGGGGKGRGGFANYGYSAGRGVGYGQYSEEMDFEDWNYEG
jgi:hypothetical protein